MNYLRLASLIIVSISCCLVVAAQTTAPVLISEATSTRAIALESTTFMREPFSPNQIFSLESDNRRRIILFAQNLILQPGEDASAITATAEDAKHTLYPLVVEYVGLVPLQQWMYEVVLRLNDNLGDVGDVLVSITYRGRSSNRVRIGVGHVGGGPPDDPASVPTPAAPYTISGQITSGGQAFSGVQVALVGTQNETTITDARGAYSFTVTPAGNYSISPSAKYYAFSPSGQNFSVLGGSRSGVDFNANRLTYAISGQALDSNGIAIDGVNVALANSSGSVLATTTTKSGGNYSFAGIPAGFAYVVTPSSTDVVVFTAQSIAELSGNLNLNLVGTRRTFNIAGQVTNGVSGMGGVTVTLAGGFGQGQRTVTTDGSGLFSFSGVAAGFDYTLTPRQTPFISFISQSINNLTSDRNINFTGTLRSYRISGKITSDWPSPVTNVGVMLQDTHGFFFRSTVIDNQGNYEFTDVPAGDTYVVTPGDSLLYSFTGGQVIQVLDSDRIVNFIGIRRTYSISGQVTDQGQTGMGGVTVTLTGAINLSTITDFKGNYSFNSLAADVNYHLRPAKDGYMFEPSGQDFAQLLSNQKANFIARRIYSISGRVTDGDGRGLLGVALNLSGPENALTKSSSDGSYSFVVTTLGEYSVTPSIEQDYYAFSPPSQILNLTENATTSFTASPSLPASPTTVLEFDGTPATADYSYFWPEGINLGHFFWEFWAMPGTNCYQRYLVSDGYGGAHALLFGFSGADDPSRYNIFGNVFTDTSYTTFYSDDGPAPNEWGHFSVGWDGKFIITYYDGVPVGKQAFTGPRRTFGPSGGGSWLLVGGSDHQNLIGRIAQVRAYEGTNPRENSPESSFAPQTLFSIEGNFLSYYFRPSQTLADLSPAGYFGSTHPGKLRGLLNGYAHDCAGCPVPKFVTDQTAPDFTNTQNPGRITGLVDKPAAVPSGTLIFDSFSRSNSTYILGGKGGLGSTEGGSVGSKTWQTNADASAPQPFGILNGRAVLLADSASIAWVQVGSSNLDISVERHEGSAGSGVNTGLCFRVVDANNYFFAYTTDDPNDPAAPKRLGVGYYQDGKRTDLITGMKMPTDWGWIALRAGTGADGEIKIFADDLLLYSTNSSVMATATGAGIYNNAPGMALTNRWDKFKVFAGQ